MANALPKIRETLEPFKVRDNKGRMFIGLQDPLSLSDDQLFIPQDLFYIIRFFDGERTITELCDEYKKRFREYLPQNRLNRMIKQLDQAYLLHNQRFKKRLNQATGEFRKSAVRQVVCAGSSYPEKADELKQQLDAYAALVKIENDFKKNRIKAVVVPHIDPQLGGKTYAHAYHLLKNQPSASKYIILGISHQPMDFCFSLTLKDFETPLGIVETDKEIVQTISELCDYDLYNDELMHRDEHSIEFQAVFLKHFISDEFKIVPILCSFPIVREDDENRQIEELVAAIKKVVSDSQDSICIITSVDFAHIGPRYGDENQPDAFQLEKVEKADKRIISTLLDNNINTFQQEFISSNNRYNICGYPALYILLKLLSPSTGYLLHYDNAIMDQFRSTVTFASIAYI